MKVLRSIVRMLFLPVAVVLILLAWSTSRKRVIRIVLMDPRFFGHQSLEPEVFWNDWRSSIERGCRDLWFCSLGRKKDSSNEYLWQLAHRRLPTIPSWFASDLQYWQKLLRLQVIRFLPASIYRLNFLSRRSTYLPEPDVWSTRRNEILSKLAEPFRPYVVFTIRASYVSYDPNDPRNRSLEDFSRAMKALIRVGYNIVRVNSRTDELIEDFSPHILDWQVLKSGEPGDELALISGASFVISTTTGGDCLALAYRRPVLYLDSARPYLVFLGTEYATFQVPKIVDCGTGAVLDFRDILSRGLAWAGEAKQFKQSGAMIVNSSAREIEANVLEFENLVARGLPESEFKDQEWRDLLMESLGDQIVPRHGEIRARMLPSSRQWFVEGRAQSL